MSEQVTKLPKWAQDRIRVAEMRLQEAETKIAQLLGVQETNTYMADLKIKRPLLKDSIIRFYLDEHDWIDVSKVRDADRIWVIGSSLVAVYPAATNSLTIGVAQ